MTSAWVPLHCHSHYSILDGLSQPDQIANRLVECGFTAGALTDHGTISGAASFQKALKETCRCGHQKKSHSGTRCLKRGCTCLGYQKNPIKPILGCEFYLCQQDATVRDPSNRRLSHLCVLAKSLEGWKNLIRASSASYRPEHLYHKPRLDLARLASFSGGQFVAFSGHVGSDLANACFADPRAAYASQNYEEARALVRPQSDLKKEVVGLACRYRDLFGKDNFSLEIQLIDAENMPAAGIVASILRWVSARTGIPCVATADSHYPRPEDAADQRVLLCSSLETTLSEVERKAAAGEDVTLGGFFRSKRYHIPLLAEMEALHTPGELAASVRIAEMCEPYDIPDKPMLPEFDCPDGLTPNAYLELLCVEGWKNKLKPRTHGGRIHGERGNSFGGEGADPVSFSEGEYRERLDRELKVIFEAGLSGYFLIVQDYCAYARTKGKVGKGRGSAAGCLASYLCGITDVDPLVYGLIFERFYNAGRNSPGRVALPDIDCDFEKNKREDVISYIRKKFGASRVAQMTTFNRMQGRGALKDVLRVNGAATFEQMNQITKNIPGEAAIADHLQEMLEERGESSIIRWALENEPDGLKEWCHINENGDLEGPLSKQFEQAIRLEGTIRSPGKHASGLIISAVDLQDLVPMSYDKGSKELYVGVDMRDAEKMGLVKFDILGTAVLDKTRAWSEIMRTGRMTI